MQYWWVNQNQTYKEETEGGFLWSPKSNKDGGKNPYYDFMLDIRRGDIIFCYSGKLIKAIGVATGPAIASPKPDFGTSGLNWANDGWMVPAEFTECEYPVVPKNIIDELLPFFPKKYSPIRADGNGNQVYLTAIGQQFAETLLKHLKIQPTATSIELPIKSEIDAERIELELSQRTDIGPTQKQQLISARRGQGVFKLNVSRIEEKCRITGVKNKYFLIASHIKPWSKSSDFEKLDGNNGLLLSPHIDRLFDRGFISFENDGDLLVSPALDRKIFENWHIPEKCNVGKFSEKQRYYLDFHRRNVFPGIDREN